MTADVKEISALTNVTRCACDNRNAVLTQRCMFILVSLGKNKKTLRAFDEFEFRSPLTKTNTALPFSTVILQFRSVWFYLASVVLKGGGNGGEVSTFVSHDLHLPVPCSITTRVK